MTDIKPATDSEIAFVEGFANDKSNGCSDHMRGVLLSLIARIRADAEWQPIETAPKDGTPVDLWLLATGENDVEFYSPTASNREGRSADWRWEKRGPNRANWYPLGGFSYPLGPEVKATHWRPLPAPPALSKGDKS